MRITVRLFAMQRERLGRRVVELEVADGSSIGDAWRHLVAAHPVLAGGEDALRFARNGVYASPSDPLADADELAVIPPVAGGDGRRRIALTPDPIVEGQVPELCSAVATAADGAVVTFLGRTRETPGTAAPGQEIEAARYRGQHVVALEYEAFESMALAVLERIAAEVAQHFGVEGLAIVHRVGLVPTGEVSVAILAAAPHRDAAFGACRYAIEELKARAPIWKAERFADGSVWVGAPARHGPAGEDGDAPAGGAADDGRADRQREQGVAEGR